MSFNENSQNDGYGNQEWSQSFSEVTVLRPPSTVTESRVLGKILKNEHQATPKPNPDFSNPPPNVNQTTRVNTSQQPLTLPKVQSQLSATAKEFIPRCQVIYTPDSYFNQECSPDEPSLSVTAAEFVPRGPEGYYPYADPYYPPLPYESYVPDPNIPLEDFNSLSLQEPFDPFSSYEAPSGSAGNSILARFLHALQVLNLNPGNMEEYLRPICEMIQGSTDTTEIVNVVVESLFEQSIHESNFRYTGARICQYLNNNLKGNPYFSGFNKIFLSRFQKEYILRDQLKNGNPGEQERLRGLSMFMAEIFFNVQAELEDGTVERLKFLPKVLVDLVRTLLSTPSDLDVKCSCQLLKLSGSLIEGMVKNLSEECVKFEEIFTQLRSLQSNSELTENTKFLIGSVLKLKDSDWNRTSSSPPKKSIHPFSTDSSDTSHFKVSEPIFYNQLGAPCSRTEAGLSGGEEEEDGAYVLNEEEEAAFLEWQAEQDAQTGGDQVAWGDNDTGYESFQIEGAVDEGGMGDEMEAAYEEFLQKQNFAHGYKPPQQPLPNTSPHQECHGYPPQPAHMLPPNQQQNMLPQQHQNQQQNLGPSNSLPQPHMPPPNQQQNQLPQHRQDQQQPNFPKNDRYHLSR